MFTLTIIIIHDLPTSKIQSKIHHQIMFTLGSAKYYTKIVKSFQSLQLQAFKY